jgi:hypothetical protein
MYLGIYDAGHLTVPEQWFQYRLILNPVLGLFTPVYVS